MGREKKWPCLFQLFEDWINVNRVQTNKLADGVCQRAFAIYFTPEVGDWRTFGEATADRPLRLDEAISTYEGDYVFGYDVHAVHILAGPRNSRAPAAGG
jgi:hypothetical protein